MAFLLYLQTVVTKDPSFLPSSSSLILIVYFPSVDPSRGLAGEEKQEEEEALLGRGAGVDGSIVAAMPE